jgi:predicted Fe-Mo cluster-binding NifX family protein
MKVALTSLGTDLDSSIDESFGRARYFLVVETDTVEIVEIIDNLQNQQASHGAGTQAAQSVADKGVEWLLTGNVGPRAFSVLESVGINISTGASGTVRDTIEKFKAGGFDKTSGPSRQGHMR